MPISEVIRRKRKELEMTQEQVAQRLGVSAPAVNKWEKGSSYPDITLLPPLARLLETDVNTLLCFREELSEEEIGQICNEMTKLICEEGLKAGFEMAEKKIREYPNCMELIYSLNTCLDGSLILYSANETEEELKIYQNKIIAYYEFIVSCAEEGRTREGAVYMLAGKYMNMERYDEAEEILKTLPERPADRRVLQAKLLANRGRASSDASETSGTGNGRGKRGGCPGDRSDRETDSRIVQSLGLQFHPASHGTFCQEERRPRVCGIYPENAAGMPGCRWAGSSGCGIPSLSETASEPAEESAGKCGFGNRAERKSIWRKHDPNTPAGTQDQPCLCFSSGG